METLRFRSAGRADGPPCLLVHGFPESSHMWEPVLPAVADAGFRALAPDLPGYGDSPLEGDGTWAHHVAALDAFADEHGLDDLVLVVHDWGGLIGVRWLLDRVERGGRCRGLALSSTGFFPDGRWHGMAELMRTPGQGEEAMERMDREGFGHLLRAAHPGFTDDQLDESFKAYATPQRRAAQLALYRSGEFSELRPYAPRLAGLDAPTLILWGSEDAFAPVSGAHRFAKQLRRPELVVLDGAGHFIWAEQPQRCADELSRFLRSL